MSEGGQACGEGLRVFGDGRFDLVITDMAMPGMSGEVMAAAVKQMFPHMTVLLLTEFDGEGSEVPGAREVVDQVLTKPISLDELQRAIARMAYPRAD